jgi:hypothetical protein
MDFPRLSASHVELAKDCIRSFHGTGPLPFRAIYRGHFKPRPREMQLTNLPKCHKPRNYTSKQNAKEKQSPEPNAFKYC